jgi:diaminohydroxyphosphoribosylaminopyrimidine deaminase / 5-amino-6-(5-phosphoribosylamino)uracil reductase
MALSTNDENFLARALELARRGVGLASPNPCVGALVVDERTGEVLGTGTHTYEGVKHAEVIALEQAGARARGATLYLTLEPCTHHGRTGPCTEAVIHAGIRRLVALMMDPNPEVSGKGFEKLRVAGVTIEIAGGKLAQEGRRLNEAFTKYIRTRLPLVTLKAAMTLDGKIAPPPGESENPTALGAGGASGGWITSEEARAHVHQLRHANDAIMVGVGTVIADDPLLTDRTGLARRRPLMRVIVDSRLRLPLESRIVKTAQKDVVVFCALAEEKKRRELERRNIRVEQVQLNTGEQSVEPAISIAQGSAALARKRVPLLDGRPDLRKIMERLGDMQITSLLIEGGALVNWAALASDIVDKVFLYYAPKILAGTGSVPFAAGAGFKRMSEAAYVKSVGIHHFGEDFAVEGYLRDPYEGL